MAGQAELWRGCFQELFFFPVFLAKMVDYWTSVYKSIPGFIADVRCQEYSGVGLDRGPKYKQQTIGMSG